MATFYRENENYTDSVEEKLKTKEKMIFRNWKLLARSKKKSKRIV